MPEALPGEVPDPARPLRAAGSTPVARSRSTAAERPPGAAASSTAVAPHAGSPPTGLSGVGRDSSSSGRRLKRRGRGSPRPGRLRSGREARSRAASSRRVSGRRAGARRACAPGRRRKLRVDDGLTVDRCGGSEGRIGERRVEHAGAGQTRPGAHPNSAKPWSSGAPGARGRRPRGPDRARGEGQLGRWRRPARRSSPMRGCRHPAPRRSGQHLRDGARAPRPTAGRPARRRRPGQGTLPAARRPAHRGARRRARARRLRIRGSPPRRPRRRGSQVPRSTSRRRSGARARTRLLVVLEQLDAELHRDEPAAAERDFGPAVVSPHEALPEAVGGREPVGVPAEHLAEPRAATSSAPSQTQRIVTGASPPFASSQ